MTDQFSERNKQARAPNSGLLEIIIHLAKMNHWLYKILREGITMFASQSPDNQLGYTELHSLEVENCGYESDSQEQVILPGTKITTMKMKHKTILLSGLTLLGMRIPVQN
ncbi:hypothetical protein GHT06_009871 [Daphnia sinensis]|uniref:Uncharacterized protein n=1 Tax=Daphnia sinensis TaxID=1820382 RepID=A0AAD5PWH5_9CRUS|nr:hypothetical protein GHT06_009871 [Daphnia sinensis]